ncbi:HD-GYP domain-containing protein [Paenibacillus sp. GD4]|uniref:HD-GYP domain-containing protein n=1 Tax=Paenibacillus sp. GD4 TaxID=3068890 RepID=UPI0027965C41|nr:HD-GYP domain-containing protein [Paenibacillus sp. GD4]MDQ1911102.1 HD-GYP domain-containing protein [Paenibacillus sp. GD4]
MRYRSLIGPLAAIVLPYVLFEVMRRTSGFDYQMNTPKGHFYIVSAVALLAGAVAAAVGIAGRRLRNIKVTFLSLAFVSLGGLFAVHGMATPGFIHHQGMLSGVAAPLSVIFATVWLWLSALPTDHPIVSCLSRFEKWLLPVWTSLVIAIGVTGMLVPTYLDFIPLTIRPFNYLVSVFTVVLNAFTLYRYYSSYLYSRFPLQIAIVYSCGWLIDSQLIMVLGERWMLSWWVYHFLLLAAVIGMVVGIHRQYAANQSLVGIFRALFTTEPVERITSCISPSIKALMIATEKKDTYTAGHNFRVALYALQLGEELGLPPDQLRALAQGTIIHDVGKIDIPDTILNKPGRLTPDERLVIEQHPMKGYEICRELGFMKEELEIIRFHHEKWDGTGYPDRLTGEQIPLLARIVAVADVYDALTSHRAYRKAMTHDEAMTFITANQGSHFCRQCVAAWERVCDRNPAKYPFTVQFPEEQPKLKLAT